MLRTLKSKSKAATRLRITNSSARSHNGFHKFEYKKIDQTYWYQSANRPFLAAFFRIYENNRSTMGCPELVKSVITLTTTASFSARISKSKRCYFDNSHIYLIFSSKCVEANRKGKH